MAAEGNDRGAVTAGARRLATDSGFPEPPHKIVGPERSEGKSKKAKGKRNGAAASTQPLTGWNSILHGVVSADRRPLP